MKAKIACLTIVLLVFGGLFFLLRPKETTIVEEPCVVETFYTIEHDGTLSSAPYIQNCTRENAERAFNEWCLINEADVCIK